MFYNVPDKVLKIDLLNKLIEFVFFHLVEHMGMINILRPILFEV